MPSATVTIIGGGISGLATAYFLGKAGLRSTIVEKSDRLGGLIRTDLIEGCQLEAGPDSYIAAKPSVTQLARELHGLDSQIIGSNDRRRRIFIVRRGKLIPMPKGMVMMAPARLGPVFQSRLFSLPTKLRFLSETLWRPKSRAGEVSVGQLVREHFGNEVLDYIAEPLLSGVYGGDVANLSAESVLPRFVKYERECGSLIKGVRQERHGADHEGSLFLSFRDGMQTLVDRLARAVAHTTQIIHAEALAAEKSGAEWRVKVGANWITSECLTLACPAQQSAKLLGSSAPFLASELEGIPHSSVILVTLVYDKASLGRPLDGFGFLVPRSERRAVAASTWIGSKFPSRLPENRAALRAFIVGKDALDLAAASKSNLVALVQAEYKRLMGIEAEPLFATVYSWPRSMPQYILGHRQRCERINLELQRRPGLWLVNNAFDGVGIPDCVRRAREAASQIGLYTQ